MDSMSPTDQRGAPPVAIEIAKKLKESFESNLIGVLLYGSSQWSQVYWDLDILVILKENSLDLNDLKILKQVQTDFKEHTLDLQLVYQSEITEPDAFSLDSHGAFFSQILKRSLVLSGSNPFADIFPTRKLFLISLITRIQRYVYQARQEYIGGGRYNKDKNPEYHRKHILRVMFDVLLMSNEWIETKQILPTFIETFPDVLTELEIGILSLESDTITNYMILYEKVYKVAWEEGLRLLKP